MSFGFLVINVCNHGEHYETPCTTIRLLGRDVVLCNIMQLTSSEIRNRLICGKIDAPSISKR